MITTVSICQDILASEESTRKHRIFATSGLVTTMFYRSYKEATLAARQYAKEQVADKWDGKTHDWVLDGAAVEKQAQALLDYARKIIDICIAGRLSKKINRILAIEIMVVGQCMREIKKGTIQEWERRLNDKAFHELPGRCQEKIVRLMLASKKAIKPSNEWESVCYPMQPTSVEVVEESPY